MNNSRVIDDSTACFISEDQETAIVIDEDDGEVLRISGEKLTFEEVEG